MVDGRALHERARESKMPAYSRMLYSKAAARNIHQVPCVSGASFSCVHLPPYM